MMMGMGGAARPPMVIINNYSNMSVKGGMPMQNQQFMNQMQPGMVRPNPMS